MRLVPCRSTVTSPASLSVAKCDERVGLGRSKCAASSPARLGPVLSSRRISLRTGWDMAEKTALRLTRSPLRTYLDTHLIRCKPNVAPKEKARRSGPLRNPANADQRL